MKRNKPWEWKKRSNKGKEDRSRSALPDRSSHPPAPARGRGLPKTAEFVEGVLQMKAKFGFVLSEDPKRGDVMIAGPTLQLAMNGDRVRARVTGEREGRRSGEITQVLTRSRSTVVGAFQRQGNLPVLVPTDESAPVNLVDLGSLVPHVGDMVVARIQIWPAAGHAAQAVLTEVLGPRDAPGVDLQTLIRKHELPDAFPPEVAAEASAFGTEVPEDAWQSRENFFQQRVFTIDGADAKDFDDAVSIERLPADPSAITSGDGGWRLGVHIADVAHYVRESPALDTEAYRRGTSVYLSGTVIPMLPFPLSDNLCSLRPDQVRLTLSCVMDIDPQGQVISARVLESAIRSVRRFTYEEVDRVLKGEAVDDVSPEIAADVREMGVLAQLLRKNRFARGSLDFDFPEAEVTLELDGRPKNIRPRERLESHRLIEDFMLLANESVARHMQHHPFLYRIHEKPDPAKLEKLKSALQLMGLPLPRHIDASHPLALAGVIKASEGTPVQGMAHLMILRSLKQAVYSPVNKGHFGLASPCYTHFTSPIRRYPDLVVHRMVKEGLEKQSRDTYWKGRLPEIAKHTSTRERIAVDAEREYLDIQKVRLMEGKIGETFTGAITSVTNFGLFVQLDDFFVEGLVHITHLGDDYYIFDEARMTLRGRRSGHTYGIGQKVKVQLAAANVIKHQLDFQLLSSEPRRTENRSSKTPNTPRQPRLPAGKPASSPARHHQRRTRHPRRRH